MIQKALVENPYCGRSDYPVELSNMFGNQSDNEYIPLDVFLDSSEIFQPYFNQPVMTKIFMGCKIVKFLDETK